MKLGENAENVAPVEPDASGFTCELKTLEESGECVGDAVEEGFGRIIRVRGGSRFRVRRNPRPTLRNRGSGTHTRGRNFGVRGFFVATFFLLDDFPVAEDFGGVLGALFPEDVRMAANHFFIDFADDVGDSETACFTGDLRMEENLEKEVAEFLG